MIFDINSLKNTFLNSIRTYVYPEQTSYTGSLSLYLEGTIDQEFYPFSTSIDTCLIYLSGTLGSPGPSTIEILSRGSTISSKTVSLEEGWNTLSIKKGDIVSRCKHTIRIYGGVDDSNDYYLGIGSNDTYFYGTIDSNKILAFSIGVRDFVRKIYPMTEELNINSLPMVVIDLISRGIVSDKYLTGDVLIEDFQVGIEVYSRYTDEVDRLCYGIERGLVKDRKTFPNIEYITPLNFSGLSFVSPEIFRRDLSFNIRAFISRE